MNRAELVESLAKATGQTKADCDRWLTAFLSTVATHMQEDEGVKLVGFGTFTTVHRRARVGRNPQTGTSIKIPPRRVPLFRPGVALKNLSLGGDSLGGDQAPKEP